MNYSQRKQELAEATEFLEKQRKVLAAEKAALQDRFKSALPTMEEIEAYAVAFGLKVEKTHDSYNSAELRYSLVCPEEYFCARYRDEQFREKLAELMEASGYDPRSPDVSSPMVSVPLGTTGFKLEIAYQVTRHEEGPFGMMIAKEVVIRSLSIVRPEEAGGDSDGKANII